MDDAATNIHNKGHIYGANFLYGKAQKKSTHFKCITCGSLENIFFTKQDKDSRNKICNLIGCFRIISLVGNILNEI